jgi:peptidase M28-like protein
MGHQNTRTLRRRDFLRAFVSSWLCFAVVAVVALVRAAAPSMDIANEAWQRGDYVAAINAYIQLLNAPGGEAFTERVAQATGELFRTTELTADGRRGRFSPDGRYIVYETGLETSRRTRIVTNDDRRTLVADLAGVSATFTRDGSKVAYLRIGDTDDIRKASEAIASASLTDRRRTAKVQMLTWLIARDSVIVTRDLASGHEIELPTPVMLKTALAYGGDDRTLFFLGTREGSDTRTDIYSISEIADGPTLAVDAGGLKGAPLVDPGGAALVYAVPAQSPLRRPVVEDDETPAARLVVAQAPVAPRAARPPSTFAIVDLRSKRVSVVSGTAPTMSADGRTLAYVARDGSEYNLMVGPTTGMQVAVKRTTSRIDAPALSADGARVTWQMMPRDDWEIFVADVAGSALTRERRLTREIQHDVLPRFIDSTHLVAMIGEPRHRRAHLYDVSVNDADAPDATPARTRLFHNNTVRTIAPEYEWNHSPDGSRILIGAERDGDTVSPERGVYLVDLTHKVTKSEVLARLRAQLKSETALRAASASTFKSIAPEIRQALSRVSVERIFGYEKALFDFDSKNISKPGNQLASEFLFNAYKSFGYEPEYQWFEPPNAHGGRTANVVATLRGTVNPELVYVISSHYDSVESGPGADDDTSGTAALLEAARVLAGHPLPATVVFASMTGEEAGLLGSREFVRRAVENHVHIAGVLNNDMIGWADDGRLDNTIRYSNPGIRDIQHAAAMTFTKLITYDALYWKGTDAMSFYDVYGDIIGGIGSYPVLGSPYYHQPTDLLENENHQLIAETSKTTIASIMLMASAPSRLTNLKATPTGSGVSLTWTPSPEKGITSYVVAYGPRQSPLEHRLATTAAEATVAGPLAPGTVLSVKAVNARGLEGWDWARVDLRASKPRRTE